MDQILTGLISCNRCGDKFPVNELSPTASQLIRARYDKLRPSLSAVQQSQADPFEGMNRAQLIEKLRDFLKDPAVARELGLPIPEPRLEAVGGPLEADQEPVYEPQEAVIEPEQGVAGQAEVAFALKASSDDQADPADVAGQEPCCPAPTAVSGQSVGSNRG